MTKQAEPIGEEYAQSVADKIWSFAQEWKISKEELVKMLKDVWWDGKED